MQNLVYIILVAGNRGNRNRNLDNLEELSRGTAHPSDLVKDRTETTVLKAAYSATNHFLWYSH